MKVILLTILRYILNIRTRILKFIPNLKAVRAMSSFLNSEVELGIVTVILVLIFTTCDFHKLPVK